MIEWEKMSNFAAGNKSYSTSTTDRSVPPPFQVRFKSVPYIGER